MRPAASATKAHAHQKTSPFRQFLAVPLRALCRARDLYVRSILSCASSVGQSHGGQHAPLPRSFSACSSRVDDGRDGDDDFRELIRAASARSLGHSSEDLDAVLQQIRRIRSEVGPGSRVLPKSCSVGMGRIEEEKECDVGGESVSVKRSRSYAVVDSRDTGL